MRGDGMGGKGWEDIGVWVLVLGRVWMGVLRRIVGDDAWLAVDIVALCPGDLV